PSDTTEIYRRPFAYSSSTSIAIKSIFGIDASQYRAQSAALSPGSTSHNRRAQKTTVRVLGDLTKQRSCQDLNPVRGSRGMVGTTRGLWPDPFARPDSARFPPRSVRGWRRHLPCLKRV